MASLFQILIGLTVAIFLYGGVLFFISQGDLKKLEMVKSAFLWGTVGIVLIILAYLIQIIIGLI